MIKKTIAIFVHQPMCSVQSANGIMNALSSTYNFKLFTTHAVEDDFFDGVSAVAFPGGFGNSDSFDKLMLPNGARIKEFVENDGKYLGICMGAYWAGSYYFDILDGVDAVQYYKRDTACTKRPHTKAMPVTWMGKPERMFFDDGCALVGDEDKFRVRARYANGDPMAIIQGGIGLIGCHPESDKFWFDSYTSTKGLYHNGKHHNLLLEFVNELMNTP